MFFLEYERNELERLADALYSIIERSEDAIVLKTFRFLPDRSATINLVIVAGLSPQHSEKSLFIIAAVFNHFVFKWSHLKLAVFVLHLYFPIRNIS